MKETKLCPFCGNESRIVVDLSRKMYQVVCGECGARSLPCLWGRSKIPVGGKRCRSDAEARQIAIDTWNTRFK